jgi:hypothetical protein
MTSLPMLSNTSTFHIGSPVSERIGAFAGTNPLAFCSLWVSMGCVGELRFRMRSIEAMEACVSYDEIREFANSKKCSRLHCNIPI